MVTSMLASGRLLVGAILRGEKYWTEKLVKRKRSQFSNHRENSSGNGRGGVGTKLAYAGGLTAALYHLYQNGHFEAQANTPKPKIREEYNFVRDTVSNVSQSVVNVENITKNGYKNTVSTGSGFIVDSSGLIITNAHVLGSRKDIKVRLKDGREFQAKLAALDEARDIAAIKINARNLPEIAFCKNNGFRVGEFVMAIGSPLALKNTVTIGIVSSMYRIGKELGLTHRKGEIGYIQTDAMINVGNSGGPLVNLNGEVIGMNTMMATAGIAFAIPVEHIVGFLDRIKTGNPEPSLPSKWLGLIVFELNEDMVYQIRMTTPEFPEYSGGLFVKQVETNSPAALAGLKDNDIILSVNGELVRSNVDLYKVMQDNDELNFVVRRDGNEMEVMVIANVV